MPIVNTFDVRIYETDIPDSVADLMPELYKCSYCVKEYMQIYHQGPELKVCVITDDQGAYRHVLYYYITGRDIEVVNTFFYINAQEIEQLQKFIFNTYPEVNRIIFRETKTNTKELSPFSQLLKKLDIYVISLPDSTGEYDEKLGKSSRKEINKSINRLKRDFKDFSVNIITGRDISMDMITHIIELNRQRMDQKSKIFDRDEEYRNKMFQLAQKYGYLITLNADGKIIAGDLCYRIDDAYYSLIIAHDINYNRYSPGIVCCYLLIQGCIENKGKILDLSWGEYDYKTSLLAQKQYVYSFAIYRSYFGKYTDIRAARERINNSIVNIKTMLGSRLNRYPRIKRLYHSAKISAFNKKKALQN